MKRFLLSLAAASLCASAVMAQETVSKTWTLAVSDFDFGTGSTCTFSPESGILWEIEKIGDGVVQESFDPNKGVQFGISGKSLQSLTISSDSFANFEITEIEIVTGVTYRGMAALTAKVNGESLKYPLLNDFNAQYNLMYDETKSFPVTFGFAPTTSTVKGKIVLNWSSIDKGLYIQSIKVTYVDIPTGVNAVGTADSIPVEYYNLQGVRVENPGKGLYIVHQGSKASKVIL